MKLNSMMLALSLGLWAVAAGAQTIDLGLDASGYRRFELYPHLEKGFAAMAKGQRRRALVAFERARLLAPDNPAVTLHLATAYRHFGAVKYAEALLRRQLTRHPGHAGLTQALQDMGAPARTKTPVPLPLPLASSSRPAAKPPAAAPAAASGPGRADLAGALKRG